MENIDNGGPAFPRHHNNEQEGMFLRDYFAGQALNGICANPDASWINPTFPMAATVKSYIIADAMLKARIQPKGEA